MSEFGLQDDDKQIILDIFKSYPQIEEAVLFGSHALNTFKATSDIDLAIKGKDIHSILAALIADFEESDLIYEIDLVDYAGITSEKLLEHIDRFGVGFYREGWVETTLGEVIILVGGGTPKTSVSSYWNGEIPWLSVVDFNNDNRWVSITEKSITNEGLNNSSTKLLNEGDLIISARGTVGALAQLKSQMAFNQSCYGIQEREGISDVNFLFYLMKFSLLKIGRNVHGAVLRV